MKVTKFEINEEDRLVICPGRLDVGRFGVQGIELSHELDQTIIETERDILYFSPLLGVAILKWLTSPDLTKIDLLMKTGNSPIKTSFIFTELPR